MGYIISLRVFLAHFDFVQASYNVQLFCPTFTLHQMLNQSANNLVAHHFMFW